LDPSSRYIPAITREMQRLVTSHTQGPEPLYNMIRYHLGWVDAAFNPVNLNAGKRLRPVLLLLSTEAHNGDWQQALPAAAAVELLHNFTLIHDDIEDGDTMRRGRPTLWTHWQIPQAINAGDALFALSYRGILALEERGVPLQRVNLALRRYTEAVIRITEGQYRDISFEDDDHVTESRYLTMIVGKTAALLGLATELGAIIAEASESSTRVQRTLGEALGKAFQMHDDLLGLWGDPAKTGKPVGVDLIKRKKTLPILHGMRTSERFRQLITAETLEKAQIAEALAELEACGSRAYTVQRVREFHNEALAALDQSGGTGDAQEALRALVNRLLNRQR
jgi:geranylgeranyl diphosphate synthase, type I